MIFTLLGESRGGAAWFGRRAGVALCWTCGAAVTMFVGLSGCISENVAQTVATENLIAATTAVTSAVVNHVLSLFFG